MNKITITFTLIEPLLAVGPGSDPNTEQSHTYIPGSLLRGALAHRFLSQGGQVASPEFDRLFLNGSTRFFNAYLVGVSKENKLQLTKPTPASWVQEKDAPKDRQRAVHNLLNDDPNTITKKMPDFFNLDGNQIYIHGPQYELAVHNTRDPEAGRATEKNGTMFRYQALAHGQKFVAEIWTQDKADALTLKNLLGDNLLLGGSQSAGYGLTAVEATEPEGVQVKQTPVAAGESFCLYLKSDAILRHPVTGQPGMDIEALFAAINYQVKIEKSFTRMHWVSGFNATWGLPLPQTWAVTKGSVWKLKADKTIPADVLTRLVQIGIGDRRAEGFGQILINPNWLQPEKAFLLHDDSNEEPQKPSRDNITFPKLEDDMVALVQQMNERISQNSLDRALLAAAQDKVAKARVVLSNSQIGRLRLRIRQAHSPDGDGLQGFVAYLEGTQKRRSVDEPFRKSRIAGQNFRSWMQRLAQDPQLVWAQMPLQDVGWQQPEDGEGWQRPLLGPDDFQLNQKMANHYATRLIEAVCELLSQGDDNR